ncbi:unnamed protein product, partial [Closterium sp. NIES-54]
MEIPRWGELSRAGVAIFDLDFDAILAAMYAVTISDEGDCYQCFPPDPGIETGALGAGEAAALGASEAAALGASTSTSSGTGESALSGTASASASRTFTLDSGASRSFFRDRTTLTPLGRPVAVSLADPFGGPVLAHFSTVLPCPAAPSGTLSGLYLPSFSTNLVSGADLQDAGVQQFTPASQRVTHCTDARSGRHLATFTRRPGSSLYTLTTASPPVTVSGQVAASSQVLAAASRSGPETLLSCAALHPTILTVGPRSPPFGSFYVPRRAPLSNRRLFSACLRALGVRDLSADKLSPRAAPCIFLGFPPDAPGWQFYHPTSRRVLSSQDITFDESVPYYRLFPYRAPSLPPPPLFLVPGPPPVDPLPPQGPAPSGVSKVDAVEPVEVAGDSGAAKGGEPGGADSGGAERVGATPGGAEPEGTTTGGAEPGGATPGGAKPGGAKPGGTTPGGAEPGGAEPEGAGPAGAVSGGSPGASSCREPLSPRELREWFSRRWRRAAGAGGAAGTGGSVAAEGAGATGLGGTRTGSTRAAGPAGTSSAGAAAGVGAEAIAVGPGGGPAGGTTGAAGGTGAGAATGAGAVPAVSRVAARPRPYFVPLLQQPAPPLPTPSPYTGLTRGLAERREPVSRPASPVHAARTSGRGSRQRPPPVPGTHRMSLRPSTAPLRAPLPSPPESPLPALADPESDSFRAASPTRSASVCPPSVGGECALGTDVLEDRQEEFQCLAAASPHLVSVLLTPEGDPDALDIPTPRSYAEAIEGPYYSQWQAAMDAEMASWKSTDTWVLQRFGFTYSLPQATSLPTRHSLSALPSDESVESSGPYLELVGCLMYLMTCTRPDLAYPLSILARYVAPGRHRLEHMAAAKRVLRYLCSTSGMGLVLGGRSPVVLTGHADASWADEQATQRSSQGYTFSLGSGSVSWRATRSSSVLGSSCEAEIYAGAMAAQELRWLTYLLTDFGEVPRSPPVLYVDKKAMLALCLEQRLEHRTKHIALRYFLARELQQRGQLRLAYVASEANTTDIFTKAFLP